MPQSTDALRCAQVFASLTHFTPFISIAALTADQVRFSLTTPLNSSLVNPIRSQPLSSRPRFLSDMRGRRSAPKRPSSLSGRTYSSQRRRGYSSTWPRFRRRLACCCCCRRFRCRRRRFRCHRFRRRRRRQSRAESTWARQAFEERHTVHNGPKPRAREQERRARATFLAEAAASAAVAAAAVAAAVVAAAAVAAAADQPPAVARSDKRE